MTTLRRFNLCDLFRFNNVNLDSLTETYNVTFYMQYLATWPNYFVTAEMAGGHVAGYMMGKVEGEGKRWHGHVTAVTVAPEYRRLGLANALMAYLENVTESIDNGYFVDLYVRASNAVAIDFYKKQGYVIYRQVIEYYSGEEDAYDMRKALKRDPTKESEIPVNPLRVPPGEFD